MFGNFDIKAGILSSDGGNFIFIVTVFAIFKLVHFVGFLVNFKQVQRFFAAILAVTRLAGNKLFIGSFFDIVVVKIIL